MKNQLRELVAASRQLLEQKSPHYDFWGQFRNSELPPVTPISHDFSEKIETLHSEMAPLLGDKIVEITDPLPAVSKLVKPVTMSKNSHPIPRSISKPAWELQTMPVMSSDNGIEALKKKMSTYINLHEPEISVLLTLPEESPPHRLFLESLSKAITRTFASASVVLFDPEVLSPSRALLILTPLFLIQKKYPNAKIHTLLKDENLSLLPLDHLDRYQEDLTNKRTLWRVVHSIMILNFDRVKISKS